MRHEHVWVARRHHQAVKDPGLLIEWRKGAEGWEGQVVYVDATTTAHKLVVEWVEAERLTPVPWRPGMGTAYG